MMTKLYVDTYSNNIPVNEAVTDIFLESFDHNEHDINNIEHPHSEQHDKREGLPNHDATSNNVPRKNLITTDVMKYGLA